MNLFALSLTRGTPSTVIVKVGYPQKPCQVKQPLAVVGVVFIALATPVDGVTRVTLWAKPLLATSRALHEILLGVLREDGLIEPLVAHRIKL